MNIQGMHMIVLLVLARLQLMRSQLLDSVKPLSLLNNVNAATKVRAKIRASVLRPFVLNLPVLLTLGSGWIDGAQELVVEVERVWGRLDGETRERIERHARVDDDQGQGGGDDFSGEGTM
jgi:hypothetical protein